MSKTWRDWEIDFLRLAWPNPQFLGKEIASILNRSIHSLKTKSKKLGIRCIVQRFKTSVSDIPKMLQLRDFEKNNKCTVLVSFKSNKKCYFKCFKNHRWKSSPSDISTSLQSKNTGCPYCNNKKVDINNCLMMTHPDITKHWDYKLNKDTPYDVTSGSDKKRWFKCKKGLHPSYLTTVYRKSNNGGCSYCHGTKVCYENCFATTHLEIAKEWHPTKNGSITPNDIMAGSNTKVWWKCQKCEHEWQIYPNNRCYRNGGCPKCKESKGEKRINNFLKLENINYKREYRIKDCKNKRPLPFDFAVFNKQNKLIGLIEYNGIQHYIIGQQFGRKNPNKKFKSIQKHDTIKVNYCKQNNTPLLIIPYTEFNNIENLVVSQIRHFLDIK